MSDPTLPPPTTSRRTGPDEGGPALGADPFATPSGPDPFVEGLEELGLVSGARPEIPIEPPHDFVDELEPPQPAPGWRSAPPVSEIDAEDPIRGLEALVPRDVMQRVSALDYLVEGEAPYDRYGFSPDVARRAFPYLYFLHRYYFRVNSEGHENIPTRGPAVLCGNHAGLLPFDAAMIVADTVMNTDPPRLPRAIVDIWAGSIPWVNVFYARGGQVIGTRENCTDLLSDGQLMLVFPEGVAGVRKTIAERYQLRPFRVGFIEQALAARAPIVPIAVIGSENQAPVLYDVKMLAKRLGLPAFPITPTFPWLGPLGLLPYPVSYRIVYGEPLHLHERFDDPDSLDPDTTRALSIEVQHVVQELVDQHR